MQIPLYTKPDLDSKSKTKITANSVDQFVHESIELDVKGLFVYETKESTWDQIRTIKGESYWIHRPSLNAKVDSLNLESQAGPLPGLRYQKIEDTLTSMILAYEGDPTGKLYQEDLKTPFIIPEDTLREMKDLRLTERLDDEGIRLPSHKITPNDNAEKTPLNKRISAYPFASKKGKVTSIDLISLQYHPTQRKEEASKRPTIYALMEYDDGWIELSGRNQKSYWVEKSDLAGFQIETIPEEKRVAEALYAARMDGLTLSDTRAVLPLLTPIPTGKTKWSDGILWIEIEAKAEISCKTNSNKSFFKAWAPYLRKSGDRLVPFFERFAAC